MEQLVVRASSSTATNAHFLGSAANRSAGGDPLSTTWARDARWWVTMVLYICWKGSRFCKGHCGAGMYSEVLSMKTITGRDRRNQQEQNQPPKET